MDKKKLKELQDRITKFEPAYKNKKWKQTWKPVIEHSFSWDWEHLVCLILYKLELVKMDIDKYDDSVDECRIPKIRSLERVLELGYKCLETDYEEPAYAFCVKHTLPYVLLEPGDIKYYYDRSKNMLDMLNIHEDPKFLEFCKEHNVDPYQNVAHGSDWDDKDNYKFWKQMNKWAAKHKQEDLNEFFGAIGKNIQEWWY